MNIKLKAYNFAFKAHNGQYRKDGKTPYFVHPIRVARRTEVYGLDDNSVCAAYLHDVLEDCKVCKEDIEKEFNSIIANYVFQLTNLSKYDLAKLGIFCRKDRKEYNFNRLQNTCKEVKIIKMLDRIDNLNDMKIYSDINFIKLYINESKLLLEKIKDASESASNELKNVIQDIQTQYKIL